MNTIIQQFSNRELALVTWLFFLLILFLFLKPFRNFIRSIAGILLKIDFVVIYLFFFIYLTLILYLFYKIGFWDFPHIKDVIFWVIGVGLLLVISGIKNEEGYFRKVLIDSIKYTLIVEFFINLHVFSYVIELLILPILVFFGIINAVSESDSKYKAVHSCTGYLLSFFGLGVLGFAIFKTLQNYRDDFTFNNLRSLLLPLVLTILFIPLSYVVAVYSVYNIIFARLILLRDLKYPISSLKRSIIRAGRLNLSRIMRIRQRLNQFDLNESRNIAEYLNKIAK